MSEPVREVPREAVRCERVARRGVDRARERPVARGVQCGNLRGAHAVPDCGLRRAQRRVRGERDGLWAGELLVRVGGK